MLPATDGRAPALVSTDPPPAICWMLDMGLLANAGADACSAGVALLLTASLLGDPLVTTDAMARASLNAKIVDISTGRLDMMWDPVPI